MQSTNRTVVVTGAGAGAGRAIAERFAREGWRVALISRDPGRLETAKRVIETLGGEAMILPLDVADAQAVFKAKDAVMQTWGRVDAWINCAMATVVGPIEAIPPEDYRRVVEVTLLGYVYGTLAALQAMQQSDRGAIVQVGSALAYRAVPLQAAYCASKFGIRGFTDSLRTELRHSGSGITVSMLQMPGMNTIQFDWAKVLLPTDYQPLGEVFDPDVAAEAAWRAVREAPRELWVGSTAIKAILGEMAFPPLLDRILARTGYDGQISDIPRPADTPDNLYAPVARDVAARGRFSDKAKLSAWTVDATRLRLGVAAVSAVALCGLLSSALMRRARR